MLVFFKAGVVQFRKNIKNQGKKKVEKQVERQNGHKKGKK